MTFEYTIKQHTYICIYIYIHIVRMYLYIMPALVYTARQRCHEFVSLQQYLTYTHRHIQARTSCFFFIESWICVICTIPQTHTIHTHAGACRRGPMLLIGQTGADHVRRLDMDATARDETVLSPDQLTSYNWLQVLDALYACVCFTVCSYVMNFASLYLRTFSALLQCMFVRFQLCFSVCSCVFNFASVYVRAKPSALLHFMHVWDSGCRVFTQHTVTDGKLSNKPRKLI
jgi:hypothetical protein